MGETSWDLQLIKKIGLALQWSFAPSFLNLILSLANDFDGEMGALYLFNDMVSDATFGALYEATGGQLGSACRVTSLQELWDAKRNAIVQKLQVLDVNLTSDNAKEIVLSQNCHSGSGSK